MLGDIHLLFLYVFYSCFEVPAPALMFGSHWRDVLWAPIFILLCSEEEDVDAPGAFFEAVDIYADPRTGKDSYQLQCFLVVRVSLHYHRLQ